MERRIEPSKEDWSKLMSTDPLSKLNDLARSELANIALERLLTEAEALRYLRLDTVDISDPAATLRRYRERRLLRATQVSRRLFYRRVELDRFLERQTEQNLR